MHVIFAIFAILKNSQKFHAAKFRCSRKCDQIIAHAVYEYLPALGECVKGVESVVCVLFGCFFGLVYCLCWYFGL